MRRSHGSGGPRARSAWRRRLARLGAALLLSATGAALASCADFDAYHVRDGMLCGTRFVDPEENECAPGPPVCGCPDPGDNCVYDGAQFHCEPAGARPDGDTCDTDADCARGLACTGGLCRQTCRIVSDCTRALSAQCLQVTWDDAYVWEYFVCVYDCDPVSPHAPIDPTGFVACAPGQTCVTETIRNTGCIASSGTATAGACTEDTDCAPGHLCHGGACTRLCWMFAPDCGGGTCVPLTSADGEPAVYLSVAPLGVCQ